MCSADPLFTNILSIATPLDLVIKSASCKQGIALRPPMSLTQNPGGGGPRGKAPGSSLTLV